MCEVVGGPDTGFPVSPAIRSQSIERTDDLSLPFLRAFRRIQCNFTAASVGNNRNRIIFVHLGQEIFECFDCERQLVRIVHASGGVYEEDKVLILDRFLGNVLCLKADQHQLRLIVPGTIRNLCRNGKCFVSVRHIIFIIEVIDHFLNPDAILRHPA